jgi:hypothetical protein
MARSNFRIEQGLEILEANGTEGVWLIKGSGAPVGTSGETDSAPVGSIWFRTDGEGEMYHKITSTSSASDWEPFADSSVYTALGLAFDAEDFGTFTGDIISDNTDAKTALQELETELVDTRDNVDDLITLSGMPENSTDFGTFTGDIISDNNDTKGALQELETAIEGISGGSYETVAVPAATPTTVSTCLVDSCNGIEWEVYVYETGDETVKEYFKVTSIHNGTAVADATSFDESTHTKLKIGDIAGLTFTPILTGTGAAQTFGLEISATAAITVRVRRTDMPL